MDISTITHVTSDYIKNALEESAKASKTENRDFGSVFQSALGMVDETNELQNSAESAEIQFSLGESNEYSRFADCPGKGKCSITVHSSCKR